MKLRERISLRTLAITSVIVVLLCIGLHIYTERDLHQFASTLPETPVAVSVDTPDEEVPPSYSEPAVTEEAEQPEPVSTDDLTPVAESTAAAAAPVAACSMPDHMTGSGKKAEKLYAGMTRSEVSRFLEGLVDPYVQNRDEQLEVLEQILVDKLGPDPKIPKVIDSLSALYTIIELGEAANATSSGDDMEGLNAFLDYAPAVVLETFMELSIDLLKPSEAEIANARALVESYKQDIDTLQLFRDTVPIVDAAIRAGELSPEEGAAFLESLGGNVSVQVDYEISEEDTPSEEVSPISPDPQAFILDFDN